MTPAYIQRKRANIQNTHLQTNIRLLKRSREGEAYLIEAFQHPAMTSSKIEMPGEVKTDPAALMASLHLLPSPTPNLEVKHTKVRGGSRLDGLPAYTHTHSSPNRSYQAVLQLCNLIQFFFPSLRNSHFHPAFPGTQSAKCPFRDLGNLQHYKPSGVDKHVYQCILTSLIQMYSFINISYLHCIINNKS